MDDHDSGLECTICLGAFTEPVCLPCGHSFCRDPCLFDCFAAASPAAPGAPHKLLPCPVCRTVHQLDPKQLAVNISLRAAIEHIEKLKARGGDQFDDPAVLNAMSSLVVSANGRGGNANNYTTPAPSPSSRGQNAIWSSLNAQSKGSNAPAPVPAYAQPTVLLSSSSPSSYAQPPASSSSSKYLAMAAKPVPPATYSNSHYYYGSGSNAQQMAVDPRTGGYQQFRPMASTPTSTASSQQTSRSAHGERFGAQQSSNYTAASNTYDVASSSNRDQGAPNQNTGTGHSPTIDEEMKKLPCFQPWKCAVCTLANECDAFRCAECKNPRPSQEHMRAMAERQQAIAKRQTQKADEASWEESWEQQRGGARRQQKASTSSSSAGTPSVAITGGASSFPLLGGAGGAPARPQQQQAQQQQTQAQTQQQVSPPPAGSALLGGILPIQQRQPAAVTNIDYSAGLGARRIRGFVTIVKADGPFPHGFIGILQEEDPEAFGVIAEWTQGHAVKPAWRLRPLGREVALATAVFQLSAVVDARLRRLPDGKPVLTESSRQILRDMLHRRVELEVEYSDLHNNFQALNVVALE